MSKTYDELKGQFSALKETAVYIRNRINVLNRFLEEKPYQTVAFLGCGSSFSVSTFVGNMLGLMLLGMTFVSSGIFASVLTENQIVSAILGFIFNMAMYMIDVIASSINVNGVKTVLQSLSFYTRYYEFTTGIINIGSVVFFLSAAFIFNFLTVRVLEKRRWG